MTRRRFPAERNLVGNDGPFWFQVDPRGATRASLAELGALRGLRLWWVDARGPIWVGDVAEPWQLRGLLERVAEYCGCRIPYGELQELQREPGP